MIELQSVKPVNFNQIQLVSNAIESVKQLQGLDRLRTPSAFGQFS